MAERRPNSAEVDATAAVLRQRVGRGELWLAVEGPSMLPTLPTSSEVLVVPGRRPRRGEVWAFVDRGGALVVHRCLRRPRHGALIFRGDNEALDDLPVEPRHLIGRVVSARDGERRSAVHRRPGRVAGTFVRRVIGRLGRLTGDRTPG